MRSVRDMERHADWYAALPPAEKAAYDKELAEHRRGLGLEDEETANEPT